MEKIHESIIRPSCTSTKELYKILTPCLTPFTDPEQFWVVHYLLQTIYTSKKVPIFKQNIKLCISTFTCIQKGEQYCLTKIDNRNFPIFILLDPSVKFYLTDNLLFFETWLPLVFKTSQDIPLNSFLPCPSRGSFSVSFVGVP